MILKYLEIAFLCENVLTILSLSTQRRHGRHYITFLNYVKHMWLIEFNTWCYVTL